MPTRLKLGVLFLAIALLVAAGWLLWFPGKRSEPASQAAVVDDDPRVTFATPYKNVRPDVRYVDDKVCAQCHVEIAESYRKHPMGRSLAPVTAVAAAQCYDKACNNPFAFQQAEFLVERRSAGIFHKETRRDPSGKVVAQSEEEIQFAIGSGTHSYSYLIERDGRLTQSPITWYEQKKTWDLSPGFSQQRNAFERPISSGCLFCHSNRVEPIHDTLNSYQQPVFRGYAIGCQRCHGPGELHVQRQERGEAIADFDDTIVNPRRLTPELREAVCEQCHLEGAIRILAPRREFLDYRPGLPWQAFWSVLVKASKTPHHHLVSAVEQMHASRCFRESEGKLGCVSCHDPHGLPGPEEKDVYYRDRCLKCHGRESPPCSLPLPERLARAKTDNCIFCHMPAFPTTDIQHVVASDHQIPRKRSPIPETQEMNEVSPGVLPLVHITGRHAEARDPRGERALGLALIATPQEAEHEHNALEWARLALPRIEKALTLWPDDVPTLEAKAYALAMLDRRGEQLELCERILREAPRREQTLVAAATSARRLGKQQAAVEYWRRAIAVNPGSIEYHAQLANVYADLKEWSKALAECRMVLRRYPGNIEARIVMVRRHLENGDAAAARSEFEQVLALKPPNEDLLRRWFQKMNR
jgi:predicted CXXCH cytochrome family protein